MTRKQKKYLFDISLAIDNIFKVHLSEVKDKSEYIENLTVQRAVERELGIIGEACHRLKKMELLLASSDSMINRRHTLIHQYDVSKPGNIWEMVHHDLPSLKSEVDELLD